MQIVKVLYKKYFDSCEKANQFIDSHKNRKNYVLTWDKIDGKRYYAVEKWKIIKDDNTVLIDDSILNELKGANNE